MALGKFLRERCTRSVKPWLRWLMEARDEQHEADKAKLRSEISRLKACSAPAIKGRE